MTFCKSIIFSHMFCVACAYSGMYIASRSPSQADHYHFGHEPPSYELSFFWEGRRRPLGDSNNNAKCGAALRPMGSLSHVAEDRDAECRNAVSKAEKLNIGEMG